MTKSERLKQYSAEQLYQELRAREAAVQAALAPLDAVGPATDPALAEFDSSTLAGTLTDMQSVIYGVDNRQDLFEVTDPLLLQDADSVVSLFRDTDVRDNGDGTVTLSTQQMRAAQNLCDSERFGTQPIGAFCSGFLVGPDLIATAGHCVTEQNVTTIRFVFGYRMHSATDAVTRIPVGEVYRGKEVVARKLTNSSTDFSVIRLDRPVTNHRIVAIRRTGKIAANQAVHVIGHPVGLPIKVAGGANVRSNTSTAFFVANLDTYGGNSGSPVFNSQTHQVEGILVRGETDFVSVGTCNISMVCPSTGCRGEDCTRIRVILPFIP